MMGAMESLPLHYFKEHAKYTGKDKLMKPDRVRQQRILESLHGQFHAMLEDVEFLHRCFTLLDGDDDGRLTAAELKRWISLLNEGEPTNEELKDALDMMPGKGGVEIDGEVVLSDPEVGVEFEDFLGVRVHLLLPPLLLWTNLSTAAHKVLSCPDNARLLHGVGSGTLEADLRGHAGARAGRKSHLHLPCRAPHCGI